MAEQPDKTLFFERVAILGLGLIGGSLARALKTTGVAQHVVAFDLDQTQLDLGLSSGVIDEWCESAADTVLEADLIVLAVPVMAVAKVLAEIKPVLQSKSILTDVGSVKGYVLEAVEDVFGEVPENFVAGHPIAGSERHGVAASDEKLFNNHKVIITPLKSTNPEAVSAIETMWQFAGASVVMMDPAHHDQVLAQTSHLPHLLA